MAWLDVGQAERRAGNWRAAEDAFFKAANAATTAEERALCFTHIGLCQLAQGAHSLEPFQTFEARFAAPEDPGAPRLLPRDDRYWTGDVCSSVLFWAEGGRGNVIQFSRFVDDVSSRLVLPLAFAVHPELVELLPGIGLVNDDVEVISLDEGRALHARGDVRHCSILSLPSIYRYRGWTLPAIPAGQKFLRRRVPLRIGLWWQGNPEYWDDARRSGTREMYAPLEALLPRVALTELQAPPALMAPGADWRERRDFAAETVVALDDLDLVITTDTAMVHLAGALGVPTWLLLHHGCNWRWAPDGPAVTGCLAYESVRVFHADGLGKTPASNMADVLNALVGLVGRAGLDGGA